MTQSRQSRTETLILMLMTIVILLMVAIAGLFFRMTQLQREVLFALESFQVVSRPQGLEIGTQVPDFTLIDTEGQTISLADLAGQKVLLAFSSIHCPACTEMYPYLKVLGATLFDHSLVGLNDEGNVATEERPRRAS